MSEETRPGAEPANEPDVTDEGDQRVMGLLSEHVPLSLLVDLAEPDGPASDEILQAEGKPEDAWWVQEGSDDETADATVDGTTDGTTDETGDQADGAPSDRA